MINKYKILANHDSIYIIYDYFQMFRKANYENYENNVYIYIIINY